MKNVEFVDHVPSRKLDRLVAGSRFTVLPSHVYETLGKTILESYAQSRAVIVTDLGSRPEFVHHGETGLLYRTGDVEELAATLRFLYERPELAAAMGQAGRELVREHHSPDSHYQAMAALYKRMTGAKEGLTDKTAAKLSFARDSEKPRLRIAFIGGHGSSESIAAWKGTTKKSDAARRQRDTTSRYIAGVISRLGRTSTTG